MVFSSSIFLWLFLPIVFWVNYFLKPQYSNIFLLFASLVFYAWGEPYFVLLMIVSIIVNWVIGKGIARFEAQKHILLAAGIIFNLGVLGYYKYAGFGVEILNFLFGREICAVPEIRLPIGISFFTFQAISYIADVYCKRTKAQDKLMNLALYISFFPQLIAGPIVKYKEINEQIENRQITGIGVSQGFRRFTYGLAKKVLISNVLGKSADIVFSMDVVTVGGKAAWIASLFYTFQIYYDFSGYSDMAIGLGKMFGFDIPENFDYPYLSSSIREFWRKWHISLSSWFKEYVYIPLGGNRKGKGRTSINLLAVFFLTGLWHGAGFQFIIWGLYHGFFSILERTGFKKVLDKSRSLSHIYLMLIVNFGWVIFRAENLWHGLFLIKRMLCPWLYLKYDISIWGYMNPHVVFIFICAFLGMGILQKAVPKEVKRRWAASGLECVYCMGILILCIASIAGDTYNPFIYFQF